jgi:hypothetical protein
MADIFISYSSEDRDRAAQLAHVLDGFGWTVWWDRQIIIGQVFDHAIERELDNAKSVIVLWSKHSVASEWVKNEAAVAAERGVLLPATIEEVKLPLEFRRKQTADLTDWQGESSHAGFQALCAGIISLMGDAPLQERMPILTKPKRWPVRKLMVITLTILIIAGFTILLIVSRQATAPTFEVQQTPSETTQPTSKTHLPNALTEPADLAVGRYFGDVIADSKAGSRSAINLAISKLDPYTIRLTSDYQRIGSVDVTLTRIGNQLFNAGGDSTVIVDLEQNPITITFNPRNELAYSGTKQQ